MAQCGRKLIWLLPAALLAYCAYQLIYAFHWAALLTVLRHADVRLFCLAGGATVIAYWLVRTARFALLLPRHAIPFGDLYLFTALALSLSLLTPAQSGEIAKMELLQRAGYVERLPGYGAWVAERTLDALVLIALALASVPWTLRAGAHLAWELAGALLIVLLLVGALLMGRRFPAGKAGALLRQIAGAFHDGRRLALAIALTLLAWGCVALGWQVSLASIGITLHPLGTLALMSGVTLLQIASLIPGGIGIAEVSIAQLLGHMDVAAASAEAGALLLRGYGVLIIALGAGHLGWWRLRQSIKHFHRTEESERTDRLDPAPEKETCDARQ